MQWGTSRRRHDLYSERTGLEGVFPVASRTELAGAQESEQPAYRFPQLEELAVRMALESGSEPTSVLPWINYMPGAARQRVPSVFRFAISSRFTNRTFEASFDVEVLLISEVSQDLIGTIPVERVFVGPIIRGIVEKKVVIREVRAELPDDLLEEYGL